MQGWQARTGLGPAGLSGGEGGHVAPKATPPEPNDGDKAKSDGGDKDASGVPQAKPQGPVAPEEAKSEGQDVKGGGGEPAAESEAAASKGNEEPKARIVKLDRRCPCELLEPQKLAE